MDLQKLIRQLEQGICPAELNYRTDAREEIDWEKVSYNTRYHSFDFYDEKFPKELRKMPAYDKIVELIVDKNVDNSPLKEITQLTEEKNKGKMYSDDDASKR